MMKFGANVTETALKGLNLAKAGNYDHVLNLKYTCRALPSCFYSFHLLTSLSPYNVRLMIDKYHHHGIIIQTIAITKYIG